VRLRLLALAVLLLPAAATSPAAAPAARPNVLLVVVDDLNLALGAYGDRTVKSPHIDRLAARGARFDSAHSQYPLCNPSRVSFLSGRRPETSGVYILGTPARTALPDAVMLPELFRRNGYFTAGAGKIFHNARVNDAASWDRYEDEPTQDEGEKAAIAARYGRGGGDGDGRPGWQMLESDGSRTRDGMNTATIRRLIAEKSAGAAPFFLALGFHKPHLPWTAPKRFFELYPEAGITPPAEPPMRDIPAIALQTELSGFAQPESRAGALRAYYACVSFIDHLLGEVLDELDRRDLTRNTLVVLFSDHGFHLGDHGGLWAKLSAFRASTRVPLIMAGPGVPAGTTVSEPVELLDVYPTLADLAGLRAPAGLEGRSLRTALHGQGTDGTAYSLVYHYDAAANRDVAGRTVIGRAWRYTEWDGGRAGRELYWHAEDPEEYRNIAKEGSHADALREAAARLSRLPAPKPGPANRPRALDRDSRKAK
jgi:iduronate 2-sulfatase